MWYEAVDTGAPSGKHEMNIGQTMYSYQKSAREGREGDEPVSSPSPQASSLQLDTGYARMMFPSLMIITYSPGASSYMPVVVFLAPSSRMIGRFCMFIDSRIQVPIISIS